MGLVSASAPIPVEAPFELELSLNGPPNTHVLLAHAAPPSWHAQQDGAPAPAALAHLLPVGTRCVGVASVRSRAPCQLDVLSVQWISPGGGGVAVEAAQAQQAQREGALGQLLRGDVHAALFWVRSESAAELASLGQLVVGWRRSGPAAMQAVEGRLEGPGRESGGGGAGGGMKDGVADDEGVVVMDPVATAIPLPSGEEVDQ